MTLIHEVEMKYICLIPLSQQNIVYCEGIVDVNDHIQFVIFFAWSHS